MIVELLIGYILGEMSMFFVIFLGAVMHEKIKKS